MPDDKLADIDGLADLKPLFSIYRTGSHAFYLYPAAVSGGAGKREGFWACSRCAEAQRVWTSETLRDPAAINGDEPWTISQDSEDLESDTDEKWLSPR